MKTKLSNFLEAKVSSVNDVNDVTMKNVLSVVIEKQIFISYRCKHMYEEVVCTCVNGEVFIC